MPSTQPSPAGSPSAVLRFMQAYWRYATQDMTAALKEHGLSMPQLATLQFLNAEGARSVSAIADHLNLSRTATSHLVERLVRKALVRREEDPRDRRQKSVTLHDGGRRLIAELHHRFADTLAALVRRVPADKRDALELAMRDVASALGDPPPEK